MMYPKISFIFNDVDECLSQNLPSDGRSFTSTHLNNLTEYSNFIDSHSDTNFILCSGRCFDQLKGIIEKIKGLKWVISENGSIIHNLISGEKIDLAAHHPAKRYLLKLKSYVEEFAKKSQIPHKENMLTIDIDKEGNPSYFNSFLETIPDDLFKDCIKQGISFDWDPTAINITLPISKQDGINKLFEILPPKLKKRSLYIGDSVSDIKGMNSCEFAATISNGDKKNKRVQEFIMLNYIPFRKGYISPFSYNKGNIDCIKYFLEFN